MCGNIDGFSKWGCIEIDEQRVSTVSSELIKQFEKYGITEFCLLVEKDIDDRGKIYLCFSYPVPSSALQLVMELIVKDVCPKPMRPLEIFALNNEYVRLPGGFHQIKRIWPTFKKPFGDFLESYLFKCSLRLDPN